MRAYLAFVRGLNWLVVVVLSVAAIVWYFDKLPYSKLAGPEGSAPQQIQEENEQAEPPVADQQQPDVQAQQAKTPTMDVQQIKQYALAGGSVLLLLNVLGLLIRLRGENRPHYLIFEKEGQGSLQVAIDAIQDTLTKSASSIPEVQDAKVEMILEKGGKMPRRAIAHCVFADVPNLFAVQESVRQLLTSRYQEIFPNEELQFEIVVDRLKSDHIKPQRKKEEAPQPKKEATEESEPFGPRYPVTEEES